MKRVFSILLTLLACMLLLTVTAAASAVEPDAGDIDVSMGWKCAHCNREVAVWTVLPESIPTTAGHYHYYLTENVTPSQLLVKSGVTICLDLKGYGITVNGRAMIVYNGATVNIMDSSAEGTGYMSGSDQRGNNVAGGTVTVQENGTLNLYSGTLKFTGTVENSAVTYGGTVYLKTNSADPTKSAVMNMYGGRVEGGALTTASGKGGAAIYVNKGAVLNVSGGKITAGQLGGSEIGKCVLFADATGKMTLSGAADVEEICTVSADNLTIKGKYTGKTRLLLKSTPSAGLTVGVSDGAVLSGDIFCVNGDGWLVEVAEETLALNTFTPSGDRHYCQHCKEVVKWNLLDAAACTTLKNTAGEYHYYLANDFTRTSQISIFEGSKVCLDLYGKDLTVEQRALYARPDVQLSIMDSVGGGAVVGTTGTNNPTGGVMVVKAGAVVNLYSGTLRLDAFYKEGYGVGVGGIVYMNEAGTMNVYGGTIQGADLVMSEYKLSLNGVGAAFYMNSTAQLNVYGGQILAGTLAEGCIGECVYLKSTTAKVNLYGSGSVADIYCTSENDQVTVFGEYSGIANVTYPDTVTLAEGQTVGKAMDADVAAATLTCGEEWMLQVSGEELVLVPNSTALVYQGTKSAKYSTLQEAIENAADGCVKLMKNVTENVTVSGDVVLDLNGKSVTGTVTVAQGATLYGMDSKTDDYTIMDAAGYGKIKVAGEGQVLGLPEEATLAEDGYMKITEEDGVSFHAVNLKLTAMTLRSEQAGVYYKSKFGGDEMVAARVEAYGVALSVKAVPTLENLATACKCTVVPQEFTAGGMDADATSTLLKNVMKTTNADQINNRNANVPIHGRAYILTEDGYLFGAAATRSFKEQVEKVDDIWETLSAEQKEAAVDMYETYRNIMQNWEIPNTIAQKDPGSDGVLKILGIGNSYTQDSMWMLYNIYKAENPGKKIVLGIAYHGGCSLAQHVQYIQEGSLEYTYYKLNDEISISTGTWKSTKDQTLKTIVENENWDIVTMQQASTYSGVPTTYNGDIQTIQRFVDQTLGYTPEFAWNMTWAYPVKDIEGDAFTTVNTTSGFATRYNSDQMTMYNAIVDTVKAKIVPDTTFSYLMPAGVAVQNANSSYLDDPELYRDYTHLNDFSRVMAAYVWYCTFEDVRVDSLKFTVIPAALTKSYKTAGGTGNMTLTQMQIDIIEEAVKNALDARDAGTFAITQSQYTVAP